MQELFLYLKNPICFPDTARPKTRDFIFLLGLYLISAMVLALFAYIVCSIFSITHKHIGLPFEMKILIGVILAPVYEEILFRSLLRFNKISLSLFLATVVIFIVVFILKRNNTFISLLSATLLVTITFVSFWSIKRISQFITSNFKYFYYSSSILFGFMHLMNFTGDIRYIIAFSIVLIAPQIIAGIILGFIRMKHGLIYSILFHMIINLTILL